MTVELRELTTNDGKDIFDMLNEIGPGENGFMNNAYGLSYEEFKSYLQENIHHSKGMNLPPGYVPQTTFWLYIDLKPVGMGKLRHYLNDSLRTHGGHIGYCIKPSERGKGYGTVILRELLKEAKAKEIDNALITCNETNTASRRVIEGNNGVLECIDDGKCKYWIKL